jgi:hypothetical protein
MGSSGLQMLRGSVSAGVHEEIVRGLLRDYGGHPYGKWRGAFWRLASLVDLDVRSGRTGVGEAAEQSLAWLSDPNRLARIHKRTIEGRVRRCASQDGLGLYLCLRAGMRGDPRLDTLAESLVATQWPDGGWNCDVRPGASHSSVNETWGPILGLHEYGATDAAGRATEFLLVHQVAFSHRTGQPMHPNVVALHYPPFWHYDVLVGLRTLASVGALDDSRTGKALDLVQSKQRPDGTWRAGARWWKRPGSKGSNVEAVDWGDAMNALLTERVRDVLQLAGRA